MRRRAAMATVTTGLVAAVGLAAPPVGGGEMAFELRSPAFAARGEIPSRFTCDGEDVSPPLAWSDPPSGTRSLALIVDDPDAPDPKAPRTIWVHWVVYGIPTSVHELAEGAGNDRLPAGARSGRNDWKREGWGGPCPPIGRHRYIHKLYALDVELGDLAGPDKAALERAMEGHVLGRAELLGTYQRLR